LSQLQKAAKRRAFCYIEARTFRDQTGWLATQSDLERFMAKRLGAKTIEVKAGHLSLISQPDTITKLVLEAAGQT